MKMGSKEWTAILGGAVAICVVAVLSAKDRAERADARAAEAQRQAQHDPGPEWRKPARKVFDASVDQLIDRYNTIQGQIDRKLLLPPKTALQDGGKNDRFHVLRHEVHPGVFVAIEIDNVSGQPFTLGMYAAGNGTDYAVSFAATLAAIGTTVLGKDRSGADKLIKACNAAIKSEAGSSEQVTDGFVVHCGTGGGMWMAGISAANV